MDLDTLRIQIDEIDRQIVELFDSRMRTAAAIAAYKKENGLPVYDPVREEAKLGAVAALAKEDLAEDTRALYRSLMALSRAYQDRLMHPVPAQKRIALIGGKLGHSYSPEIHTRLGMTYPYELREIASEDIGDFLDTCPYDGFNVTIPYKKDIIPYLCGMSDTARRLGSVNTVLRTPQGFWGDNTDYEGFAYMVRRSGYDVRGKKAVILGAGGVCPTVCAVLSDLGASPITVLSHQDNTPEMRALHADARIVVNTTPVGMYPHNDASPVPADAFPAMQCALDLIYNPFETAFLADARARGCITGSGISMLVAQARRGAELFCGAPLDDSLCTRVTDEMIRARRNLILIGMPGSGKSTVGQEAAKRLGRCFVDLDEEIVRAAGKPIPAIFAEDGEEVFRRIEHDVICEVCRGSALVIATGGGCVTRAENYRPMAQNGILIQICRPADSLPTAGRPLSLQHTPKALWEERAPLYRAFADTAVENTGTVDETVDALLAAFDAVPTALRT